MYDLAGYGEMIADRVRFEAYSRALRNAVSPGAVVVDLGAGPGVMAVLACQFGARRVFAIEPSPIIQVARQIAAANSCADKIEFIEELSTRVTLPERAQVIVSDLRGVLPLFTRHIPSIVDARRRFLAPGGRLVPHSDTLWAAVVEAPDFYAKLVKPWEHSAPALDLGSARQMGANTFLKARMKPQQFLAKPQCWKTLDYCSIESPDAEGTLEWTIERAGIGHGLLVWFDTELSDSVGFSNAPGAPETIYGSTFFPWVQPVSLAAGDPIQLMLQAKLVETDYTWHWKTRVASAGKPGETRLVFDQSSLEGALLSPTQLKKAAADFIPELSEEGRINARAFTLMDGRAPLEEIAKQLAAEFPQRFSHWRQALGHAGALSQKYSR
jgi:protein arginine N-methyltransferase 1